MTHQEYTLLLERSLPKWVIEASRYSPTVNNALAECAREQKPIAEVSWHILAHVYAENGSLKDRMLEEAQRQTHYFVRD